MNRAAMIVRRQLLPEPSCLICRDAPVKPALSAPIAPSISMATKTSLSSDAAAEPAFAAARLICRRHDKDSYLLSHFLPPSVRDGICALYAFRRVLVATLQQPASTKEGAPTTLDGGCCSSNSIDATATLWRTRLDEIYEHRLTLPLPQFRDESQNAIRAFQLTIDRFQIPRQYLFDLVEAHRVALSVLRYATWRSLEEHCQGVAGNVGLIATCILGLTNGDARAPAALFANAVRLTTLLRDVKTDWERGRVYLPLEDLARFKYSERDLSAGVVNDNFRQLMRHQIARARDLYRRGAQGLCSLPPDGSRLAAAAFGLIHSGVLSAIERQGYDVFGRRAALSAPRKLRRLAPAWRLARHAPGRPIPAVF